jgi:hypothetical protein
LKHGRDSFEPAAYAKAIRIRRTEDAAFRIALRCLQKGIHSQSRVKRWLLALLSALLSPWQARYFIDRLRVRIAMRRQRGAASDRWLAEHAVD